MSKSQSLRLRDLKDIYRLIGECRELGNDARQWRRHMFQELSRLVGAQVGCGGEVCDLWTDRPKVRQSIDLGWAGEKERARFLDFMQAQGPAGTPEFQQVLRGPARTLVTRLRPQVIDDREWYRSEHFNEYRRISGIDNNLFSLATLPGDLIPGAPGVQNVLTLHRGLGEPCFQRRERLLVHWFHHELLPLLGGPLALAQCHLL